MTRLFVLVKPLTMTYKKEGVAWFIFNEAGDALESGCCSTIGEANIASGLGKQRHDLTTKYGVHKLINCNRVQHADRAAYEAVIPRTKEAFEAFLAQEAIKSYG